MLINKNSIEHIKTLPNNYYDLAIVDPPYLTTNEDWDKEEVITEEFVYDLFNVMSEQSSIYLFCGMGEKSQSLIRWFPLFSKYFHFKDIITWKKSRGIGMRKGWLYTREEILWFVKDNKKFIWNKENQYSEETRKKNKDGSIIQGYNGRKCKSDFKRLTNVWTDISELTKDVNGIKFHGTPKPLKLIDRIFDLHTNESSKILDPFAGSGVTEIISRQRQLESLSIELDTEIYTKALERIETHEY